MSKRIIVFVIAFSVAAIGQLPVRIVSPDKTLEASVTRANNKNIF
jgi:hypothetical protein